MKQEDVRDTFRNISTCTLTDVVSPDPLPPTPPSSAMKTAKNKNEELNDHQPAAEGDKYLKYFSDYLCSPSVEAVTKTYQHELRSL
jgi:hypothetical protein